MADRSTVHLTRILLATALLLPLYAQAQEPLYQVELLVFSQSGGGAAEQFDPMPELAYPARSRFLIYPGEQAAPTEIPVNTLPPAAATPAPGTAPLPPAQPVPYATLPSEQRQFAGKVAAMQRSGRYRILFHEAWIQPMGSQAEALPIVLDRSGDGGPWPALQGTIKLYLSRFYYLETNLWLNTQGEYLQGGWHMPAPPLSPVSSARNNMLPAQGQYGTASSIGASSQALVASAEGSATNAATAQRSYPFRHAVLLKETRRMRSGEVVYIDHPLLGVLVTIHPLTAPDAAPIN